MKSKNRKFAKSEFLSFRFFLFIVEAKNGLEDICTNDNSSIHDFFFKKRAISSLFFL